jgi:thiosulfate dehydrogenase
MKAMIAYIEYIGKDVPKGEEAKASGIYDLEFLEGLLILQRKNQYTILNAPAAIRKWPRILAEDKKNIPIRHCGALIPIIAVQDFGISRFAGYIKYNMPLGATYEIQY